MLVVRVRSSGVAFEVIGDMACNPPTVRPVAGSLPHLRPFDSIGAAALMAHAPAQAPAARQFWSPADLAAVQPALTA